MLAQGLLSFVAAASALPPHHPQNYAPRELIDRIAKSNPRSLSGASRDVLPSGPARHSTFRAGLKVSPLTFGGDPTGRKDSWTAVNAALNVCLNQSSLSPNGFFPGQDTTPSFGPIRDMGGCDIDLEGGEYLLSRPIVIPEMNANMQLGRGSLVAGPGFVGDFLVVVGKQDSCRVPQGSCNIDINFPELFLDGARRASGMQINHVMGVTIGPGGYFLNFTQFGLQINGGHEVMMDRCWLGETNFDFDHEQHGVVPNATAIQINGNDHYILNTIVFSSKIGLEVNGAADYITGTHVWFPTIAFHVTRSGNRFNGCYMDGGRAVFEGSAVKDNIWTNGFECCQGASAAPGTTASGITLVGNSIGPGLQIMNNEFGGGSIYHCSTFDPVSGFCDDQPPAGRAHASKSCSAILNITVAGRIGLREVTGTKTEEACATACCGDPTCTVYQFCPANGKCAGATGSNAQCWTGKLDNCDSGSRPGWVGKACGGIKPAGPIAVTGVRIEDNSFPRNAKSTKATASVTQTQATVWQFDFCDTLLFPTIAVTKVHVSAESGFPVAIARPTKNCSLTVETSVPTTGTITVEVDSSVADNAHYA